MGVETLEDRRLLAVDLSPGDLVVVGYSSDGTGDEFAVTTLTDLTAGSVIHFTDRSWDQTNGVFVGVGTESDQFTRSYTVPAGGVTAGTILDDVDLGGSIGNVLTILGDQIFIYQTADNNAESTPTLIYGFSTDDASGQDTSPVDGWADVGTTITAQKTNLPPGGTAITSAGQTNNAFGWSFVNGSEVDNLKYTGPETAADKSTWLARINDPSNWTTDNTNPIDVSSNQFPHGNPGGSFPVTTGALSTDLALDKSDDGSNAVAGQNYVYSLKVTNNGPDASTGGTVSDTLPTGWTFVSGTGCTGTGTGFDCTVGALANGAMQTFNVTVSVPASQAAGQVTNSATVIANETDPTSGNNSDTEMTTVGAETDLALDKSDDGSDAVAGTNYAYSLKVTNSGPSNSSGGTVSDTLPSGWTFVSGTGCTGTAAGFDCTVAALNVGAMQTFDVVVAVPSSQTAGTVNNSATVTANETDSATGNNSDDEDTTVITQTDLSITKADSPDPVVAGNDLTYTMTVTNNGPSNSTGGTVTDVLPAGLTFSSSSDCTEAAGTVTCAIGALGVGGSQIVSFVATVDPGQTAAISNTATVAANETDPTSGNDSATENTVVNTEADLVIAKTDSPDPVIAGNQLVYTVTVQNNGPSDAQNVVVTDTLPAGVTFDSTAGCEESPAAGVPTCTLGTITSGNSKMFTITVDVDAGTTGMITNMASASSSTPLTNTSDDSVSIMTQVNAETDLSITKSDTPDPVVAGTDLTYTMTVTNNGPSNSTGATVTDALPAGLTFSSSSDCTEAAGTVTCAIGALDVGARQMVSFVAAVDPGQTAAISNTATVGGNETDPTSGNDSAAESTTVITEADLSITKSDDPDPAVAGLTMLTYTVRVDNAGPSDAQNVVVTDTLPAGVTFVSTTGCAEDPNGVPTCSLGTIAAGGSKQYTIEVTVDATMTPTTLTNTASVTSDTTDPGDGNNSTTEDTRTGMIIIRADSFEHAHEIAMGDPFHAEGLREFDIWNWSMNEGSFTVTINYSDQTAAVV